MPSLTTAPTKRTTTRTRTPSSQIRRTWSWTARAATPPIPRTGSAWCWPRPKPKTAFPPMPAPRCTSADSGARSRRLPSRAPKKGQPYLDIGKPPSAFDDDLVDAAIDVLRKTSQLDVEDDTLIDVSPGALGNNPLGSNDGHGRAKNPVTRQALRRPSDQAQRLRARVGRVLGGRSELGDAARALERDRQSCRR